jgi:hypothetical protein
MAGQGSRSNRGRFRPDRDSPGPDTPLELGKAGWRDTLMPGHSVSPSGTGRGPTAHVSQNGVRLVGLGPKPR